MNRLTIGISAATAIACLAACASDPDTSSNVGAAEAGVTGTDASIDGGAGNDAGADSMTITLPETGTQIVPNTDCKPGNDADGDGFTTEQGDCNDCDKTVNPGAFDFPSDAFDEDCSGSPAQRGENECDKGLDIASTAAEDAARSIGLCKFTSADKKDWGVISARFTTADGSGSLDSPLQVGILPKFGALTPRVGESILALSSGVARAPDQQGYTQTQNDELNGGEHRPPAGFPKASSVCPGDILDVFSSRVYNQAALEVKIRVPTNAFSLSFDSIFYSYEYPDFICAPFNDFYATYLEPKDKGDGNIVFDVNGDPIGVNNGLLAVCDPSIQKPDAEKKFECKQGVELLKGTGFGASEYVEPAVMLGNLVLSPEKKGRGGASTGWLTTLAPVQAGSVITLRFTVWDTADAALDSTVLIDRFDWSVAKPTTAMTTPTPILL
jgi:hypothetical protein